MDPNKDPNQMSYEDAFDKDEPPQTPPNDDDEFGIIPDPEEVNGEGGGEAAAAPAVAVVVDASPGDSGAEGGEAQAATEQAQADENDTPPDAAETAGAQENPAVDADDNQAAVDAAIKQLTDDFGEDFVKAVQLVASAAAGKSAEHESGEPSVKEMIEEIKNLKARMHFERIFDAHEDFMDIAQSPEFEAWINSKPDDEKQALQGTFDHGNARAVIKMLDQYKQETAKPTDPAPTEDDFSDAEGVASSGVRMPATAPAGGMSYEDAWDKA